MPKSPEKEGRIVQQGRSSGQARVRSVGKGERDINIVLFLFPVLLFWELAERARIIEVIIRNEIGDNNHPK
jgi:hypothetical protein